MLVANQLEKVFNKRYELNVTMGAEMEVYLVQYIEGDFLDKYVVNEDNNIIKEIYERMDERVFRDYYPYQLELRTNPSDDPKEVANELIELFNEAQKVAKGVGCKLIPVSYLRGRLFNGLHVHVSYTPRVSTEIMIKKILAVYPFIVDIARLSLSSPVSEPEIGNILSKRIYSEVHVSTPPANMKLSNIIEMWTEDVHDQAHARYYDIILNTNRREGRHRIKDVDTIEVRIFDVIGSMSYLRYVLELTYYAFKYINHNWINDYRKNYASRTTLYKVYCTIRRNMITPTEYINPLTGTNATTLSEYFINRSYPNDSWIYMMWWNYDEFCTPDYQGEHNYLII